MSAKDVGQLLRQAREARGASVDEAAAATRIRGYYIQALERGDFGELPSPVQVRGFLRAYAEYLDIDVEELFARLQSHAQAIAVGDPQVEGAEQVAEQAAASLAAAQAIYTEIGEQLQARRKSLELSLEEAEQHTHIPEHYLRRMEAGGFGEFPSPTQARGMLNNYADFLGLQSAAVMDRYAEALQSRRAPGTTSRLALRRPRVRLPAGLRNAFSPDLLLGGLLGLALLVFVVWGIGRVNAARAAAEPQATAPGLADLLEPTATSLALVTLTPQGGGVEFNLVEDGAPAEENIEPDTQAASNPGNVNIRLLSSQRTFLRVTADEQTVFEGRTLPNTTYSFSANEAITLLTGNGAALRLFIGDQDMGLLGIYGEVVELVIGSQGLTTPTPTPTPTLDPAAETGTAQPSPTLSATPTPPATATPTVDSATPSP